MQRTSSSASRGTPTTPRHTLPSASATGLPSAPNLPQRPSSPSKTNTAASTTTTTTTSVATLNAQKLTQSMAQSMTIDEMRDLHQRARHDADAKRTELRLVLASRYRELVGSSDEVTQMKERAHELHDLVEALPKLMQKIVYADNHAQRGEDGGSSSNGMDEHKQHEEEEAAASAVGETSDQATARVRRSLARLPRILHRALDRNDVHTATVTLIQLFTLLASHTNAYPVANALSSSSSATPSTIATPPLDPILDAQMRMIFLQVQTLPDRIRRLSHAMLTRAADGDTGCRASAAALASLSLLDETHNNGNTGAEGALSSSKDRADQLLQIYFESKAKLLVSLLGQLKPDDDTNNAEEILSKIVVILQHDIVVHPYQMFVIRKLPGDDDDDGTQSNHPILQTLPLFDKDIVKAKCSKFLSAHLPLIRTKVKTVLVTIAGTTASALGQIRQSLYDLTDGAESMARLNENNICTWDEAVFSMIDVRSVWNNTDAEGGPQNRFSLWGALFSHTFSSLVHSLLTTSFQSVHTQVISTLRDSLAHAPHLTAMILPHEAYRNTLSMATALDRSLLRVSADAHELLVHAEERVESERRLRQSLYVQTCEIMGRLVCELRRLATTAAATKGIGGSENESSDDDDVENISDTAATTALIVGRLCFLLKVRLTSLRTLLAPSASDTTGGGRIAPVDIRSAFDLADDDEDGLISFDEAMEAVESAFAGTSFRGADMVRETLLLTDNDNSATARESTSTNTSGVHGTAASASMPNNVSLNELVLLTARGLRHDASGPESALGTVQQSLDHIVDACFQRWAKSVLSLPIATFRHCLRDFVHTASAVPDTEWQRLRSSPTGRTVSPHVAAVFLDLASRLNQTVSPSDYLSPVPSTNYAVSLGMTVPDGSTGIPTLMDTMRWALLREALSTVTRVIHDVVTSPEKGVPLDQSGPSALVQLNVDLSFVRVAFLEDNRCGFGPSSSDTTDPSSQKMLDTVLAHTMQLLKQQQDRSLLQSLPQLTTESHQTLWETSDLFLSSLLGEQSSMTAAAEDGSTAGPIFPGPLASSRRFVVLPVPADRSISDIQIRGKYAKEKQAAEDRQESATSNVIAGGFGFLSSMLKTKK